MARKRILRMQRKTGPRERTRLALENAIFEEVHMSCLTHTHFTVKYVRKTKLIITQCLGWYTTPSHFAYYCGTSHRHA